MQLMQMEQVILTQIITTIMISYACPVVLENLRS